MTMTNQVQVNSFDPENPEPTAKEWLERVETFAHNSNLSEDQLYSFVRGKLQGSAKVWLKRSKVSSWQEFRNAFQKAFPEKDSSTVTFHHPNIRVLERRRKLPNETTDEYIQDMLKLGNRMKMSEDIIVRSIVTGLDDPVLSKAVPPGTSVQQLKSAIGWQKELGGLLDQYHESTVTMDDFERLADNMEHIALSGDNLVRTLHGNQQVLQTIGNELSSVFRQQRASLSCNLSNLGTSKTHQLVVHLKTSVSSDFVARRTPSDFHVKSRPLQTSLISHLTCSVIQKASAIPTLTLSEVRELILDLSQLNSAVSRELPNHIQPEPLLSALSGFRYFTTLDFDGGHLQIPLAPSSRPYFSFATPYGAFQFQRAPKHFTNTTIIFNKILIEVARKLPTGDVVVLHDTLVLPARDTAEGLAKLSRTLAALGAFGLTAHLHRSRFFEQRIQLFNWVVQYGKVISIGLPLQLPVSRAHRLVLMISECADGKTFESLLEERSQEHGRSRVIGSFKKESYPD
uniref:Retrotransposon gag domain-containing protein n=1 Tax=Anopheles maculatus TaxID=74869 RepID=A0A182SRD3_9DIPT